MAFARAAACDASASGSLLPGTTGIPNDCARSRAFTLSPNNASAAADGPMKAMPSAVQRSANGAFSARKP